jgi:hypothetical protein
MAPRIPALLVALSAALPAMAQGPTLGGCPVLPADSIWNVPVDTLPVDANSAAYVSSIGADVGVHPDFGSALWEGGPIGIPFVTVGAAEAEVPIHFVAYGDESDPGPYPVPRDAPIEGGDAGDGDRHVLVVDTDACRLYELYRAFPQADRSWEADSGAVYDLRSHALRPDGWTSADAAGLPIFPGLARYDEVAAGEIRHAVRFTAPRTRKAHVWPARHDASSQTGTALPPMGQRFRLKASVDVTRFSPQVQVILRALQKYGMILADNGSAWYVSGAPDPGWDDDSLVSELRQVRGSDFEAVDVSSLRIHPDSGQARTGSAPPPPPPPAPSLTLVSPNGGESWKKRTTQTLRWSSEGVTGKVRIDLSRDGGLSWTTLFAATKNDGIHPWQVTGKVTTRARLRIVSVASPAVQDASDGDFQIR